VFAVDTNILNLNQFYLTLLKELLVWSLYFSYLCLEQWITMQTLWTLLTYETSSFVLYCIYGKNAPKFVCINMNGYNCTEFSNPKLNFWSFNV